MNAQTAHTPTHTDLILRGLEYCMDWKDKKPDAITFATALADARQHIIDSDRENALLVDQNERMRQALQELLRVDDEWHGSVNSEMANARATARAALNPPSTK